MKEYVVNEATEALDVEPEDITRRRVRILSIDHREMLELLAHRDETEFLSHAEFPALPADYEIVGVHDSFERQAFDAIVWSPTFEPTPAYAEIPRLAHLPKGRRVTLYRRVDEEGADVIAEHDKLLAFKTYVHARLDAAGVPVDPESTHKAEGCRVGGRLDHVFAERERLASIERAANALLDARASQHRAFVAGEPDAIDETHEAALAAIATLAAAVGRRDAFVSPQRGRP